MHVEWSDLALEDLEDISSYISKDSPHYAREFVEKIFVATDRLEIFPRGGRYVPEAANKSIREIIMQNYRIMYRVEEDRVLILTVIHGSRNLGDAGKNEPGK